jgi:enoyl-CoA hydratase
METLVTYDSTDGISTIALDDGKANVLSARMLGEINAALDRAEAERNVVMLTGRPGMFSGGFDLAVFKEGGAPVAEMLEAGARTAERLLSFPSPVVVACTGHAIAMGAFLLLSGDVRLGVAKGAFKIVVNEVQIGLTVPRFAVEVCRQRLLPTRFNTAVLTAQPHTPEQAVEAGFLDYVVPENELMSAARDKAKQLSTLARSAFTATKLRARESTLVALRQAIELDAQDWSRYAS